MQPWITGTILAIGLGLSLAPQTARADYMDLPEYRPVERKMRHILRDCVEPVSYGDAPTSVIEQCSDEIIALCLREGPAADSTLGMKACGSAAGKLLDEEMNRVWAEIKREASKSQFKAILEKQRAWLRYRSDEVDAAAAEYDGGSMGGVAGWHTYARMAATRVGRLYKMLDDL